jgi:G3E family GTPase
VRSLFQLIDLRASFDMVVIETSGLAEPAPVAQTLYADERIRQEFELSGVVAVVDAKNIAACLAESDEAQEQIAFSDLVLINKTDLVLPEELERTAAQISELNRFANIVQARNAEIELDRILDLERSAFWENTGAESDGHHHHDHESHRSGHDGGHDEHDHNHRHLKNIDSLSLLLAGPLDHMKVSMWFRGIIAESGGNILRMKGILNLRADAEQFLIQGVRNDFEGRPGRPWEEAGERLSRLVFIGRGLDHRKLKEGFENCLAAGLDKPAETADPFGRYIEISPLTLEQIRYWMRQNFGFSKDTPIVVKEVPCVKPGCPPIETAIVAIIENAPPRHFKVQRPINEITFDHVYDLMENPMPCC